jgi:DNA-binding transcriptional LysR family regulator
MDKSPITIEALQTLDAIERRGSFAKAAEELNKATSAVSYVIQKLEEQLDVTLFQRQGRRSVLTPAGQLMLAEGREILESTSRLANKAKEVATGWEPRIRIAVECLVQYPKFFMTLQTFLEEQPSIEIDVFECVLNGGWEALDHGRADLIVGVPGPVPLQKGYRAIPLKSIALVPVIAANHKLAKLINSPETASSSLSALRKVITHDTSISDIARSAGLSSDGKKFFVQTIDQKVEAICAGIGIGHLPRYRIQTLLDQGELLELGAHNQTIDEFFMAWKISNKGKGLQALSKQLGQALGQA